MGMKKKQKIHKSVKLRTIFIGYLSVFCIGILCWILILMVPFSIPSFSGIFLPADYTEKKVWSAKEVIATSEIVTRNQIPDLCNYAVYTPDGAMISGNLSPNEAKKAWKLVQNSEKAQDFSHYYLKISRKNEVCIVRYSLTLQFSSPVLRKYLPNPELMAFLLFGFGFLLGVVVLASSFGKKMTQKMSGLQNATEKIQNQDLNFTIESSGVFEIDNALFSIDKMKETLKISLKKQWDLEQTRREQMSALAHDIKTPITIVRGNVDLLAETNQTEEQKEYTNYIEESIHQMEQYIKTLIEISKTEMGYILCKENINIKRFMDEIYSYTMAFTAVKKLKLDFKVGNLPPFFMVDSDLLERAIMNIVSNAVEYSPENSKIDFIVDVTKGCIRFCVVDYGKGFSPADLKEATTQFYMSDKSRTSKAHYGMGLYITKSIVELHDGTLQIANSHITGGGQVTIEIPI